MLEAKLIVVGGDAKVTEVKLSLPSVIGRGKSATLTLPHPLVSRRHCEIYEADGKLMVRDLGSLNGTFVGSELVTEAVLPPGELLTIGTVTFRAVYENEETSTAALPSNEGTKKNHATTYVSPPDQESPTPAAPVEVANKGDDIKFLEASDPPPSKVKDSDDDLSAFLNNME